MRHWLMKSEPDAFGIEDLKAKGTAPWDGVRNFLARNFMKEMAVGDRVLFYHSSCKPPGVAGLATVARTAYGDHTALDPASDYYDARATPDNPIWMMVDVAFAEILPRLVTIDELRAVPELSDLMMFTHNRLSVIPVSPLHYQTIVALARGPAPAGIPAPIPAKQAVKPESGRNAAGKGGKPAGKAAGKPAGKHAATSPAKTRRKS